MCSDITSHAHPEKNSTVHGRVWWTRGSHGPQERAAGSWVWSHECGTPYSSKRSLKPASFTQLSQGANTAAVLASGWGHIGVAVGGQCARGNADLWTSAHVMAEEPALAWYTISVHTWRAYCARISFPASEVCDLHRCHHGL